MKDYKLAFFLIGHKAHIHHVIPIACACSVIEGFQVDVLTSTEVNYRIINDLLELYPDNKCNVVLLKPTKWYELTRKFKKKPYPTYDNIINNNFDRIVSYDVLLTPQHYLNRIMDRDEAKNKTYVLLTHGSGDSPVSYSKAKSRYDLTLLGSDEIIRLAKANGLEGNTIYKSIGYAKLEIAEKLKTDKPFNNNLPTVVYNPSYVKKYSSWDKWGYQILDYFAHQSKFNLIFAPHLKLFQNKSIKKLRNRYSSCDNILIDTDTDALIDMTYTKYADIYLGDISSQGYEFLYKPRPCVFLNPENKEMIKMWELGDVISDINDFDIAINNALKNHINYIEIQKEEFSKRFSVTDVLPGERGAQVIKEFMIKER